LNKDERLRLLILKALFNINEAIMSENSQKLKMIGVDIAKDKLDIVFDNQKLITIANRELAFEKLFKAKRFRVNQQGIGAALKRLLVK